MLTPMFLTIHACSSSSLLGPSYCSLRERVFTRSTMSRKSLASSRSSASGVTPIAASAGGISATPIFANSGCTFEDFRVGDVCGTSLDRRRDLRLCDKLEEGGKQFLLRLRVELGFTLAQL